MILQETIRERVLASHPNAWVDVATNDDVHFTLNVVDARLSGLSRIQQHRSIYKALGDLFNQGLHALEIQVNAPNKEQK